MALAGWRLTCTTKLPKGSRKSYPGVHGNILIRGSGRKLPKGSRGERVVVFLIKSLNNSYFLHACMVSKLDLATMVSETLAFVLPIAFGSALAWGAFNHMKFLEMTYTLQSSGGVGAVFQYIVFNILWVAFFWLVIASVIAGGIEMATAQARPVLEMFGLPVPKTTVEGGFRTMFTAIVAWELVNAILQSVFGVTPPSPVSALAPPISIYSIGFIGTATGLSLGAVILTPLIIRALYSEAVVEL